MTRDILVRLRNFITCEYDNNDNKKLISLKIKEWNVVLLVHRKEWEIFITDELFEIETLETNGQIRDRSRSKPRTLSWFVEVVFRVRHVTEPKSRVG